MPTSSLVDLTFVVERVVETMTKPKTRYVIGAVARCIIMLTYLRDTLRDRALSLIDLQYVAFRESSSRS